MGDRLRGKNAIVTGGAGGIGRQICYSLAREGANIVVNDIGAARDGTGTSKGPVDEVVAEIKKIGVDAIPNFDSVTDFDAAAGLVQSCVDKWGKLDILINCHGNVNAAMIWNMTHEQFTSLIDIQLTGTFNTCRHACVLFRGQRSGRILNVSSDAWRGTGGQVNYSAAKGGVVSLTRSIARELGRYGVTANCFIPVAATRQTMDEDMKQNLIKRVQAGIITQQQYDDYVAGLPGPEGVPPIVTYLATDEARFINGQVFHAERDRISRYCEPVEVKSLCRSDGNVFSTEELIKLAPSVLMTDYVNPAPPQEEKVQPEK